MKATLVPKSICTSKTGLPKTARRILLFDLSVRGHHPSYILHLIRYWQTHRLPGRLEIVVSPRFLQEHSEVVDWVTKHRLETVRFTAISALEEAALNARKFGWQRALRNFQEWRLLCLYARQMRANHCLLMYFDTSVLPLAFARSAPCPVSGIYFRPTFHYHRWAKGDRPLKSRLRAWREQWLLRRILRHPQLEVLFSLDHFVVDRLNQLSKTHRVVPLPDPVDTAAEVGDRAQGLRQQLGIDGDRTVFLLFGSLTQRKGLYQLLEAIRQLSEAECQRLCLLLVGESNIEAQIQGQIDQLCKDKPIQVIARYEFVAEGDVPAYFDLSDIVLAPYQQHVGMSGILLLAAAAQKPVLSADYGLMGEVVRRHQLGLTVDSAAANQIAAGMARCLHAAQRGKIDELGDRAMMQTFAAQNSSEKFAETIFSHWYCV